MPRQNDAADFPWTQTRADRSTLERQAPSREPSTAADVAVPLQQSMVCGAFGAVLAAAIVALVTKDAQLILLATGIGGFGVAATAWVVLLADHRALLWSIERATRTDLDGDGRVGPQELRIEVAHRDESGRLARMEYLTIPGVDAHRLRQFARAVVKGDRMTVHKWTATGALFTRGEFDAIMGTLERGGLVTRGSGAAGRQLTRSGRVIFERLAE